MSNKPDYPSHKTNHETESKSTFSERFRKIRNQTEAICQPLAIEDYVVQPVVDVSPPK